MKIKFHYLVVLCFFSTFGFAQQWVDQVYDVDTIVDINYGSALNFNNTNVQLHMDVFLPKCQDTTTKRPLMIVAHGGGLIAGTYKEASIQDICAQFARRGYVTASVEYRLGYVCDDTIHECNFPSYPCLFATDTMEWYRAYYRGIQDVKGATRYLVNRKDQFHIDEQNVFVVGESAGAIVTIGSAYLDDPSEKPAAAGAISPALIPSALSQDTCDMNNNELFSGSVARPDLGTIDGSIEPALFPYTIRGVGNLYGAMFFDLLTTSNTAVKPAMYSFHQACDLVVPWNSKEVYFGLTWCFTNGYNCNGIKNTPIIHGTKTMTDWNTNLSLGYNFQSEYVNIPFPYEYIGFQPRNCVDQVLNGNGCHAYDNKTTRMTNMANFFATKIVNPEVCVPYNSLITLNENGVLVYPNPVQDVLNITSEKFITSIRIHRPSRSIVETHELQTNAFQTKLPGLASGIYLLEITLENQEVLKTIFRK